MILGLDPWLFNLNNGQNRWHSIQSAYLEGVERFEVKSKSTILGPQNSFAIEKFTELISPSYFQQSFKALTTVNGRYYPTQENITDEFLKLADGSIQYDRQYRTVSAPAVRKSAIAFTQGKVYSLESFNEIDPGLRNQFDEFVSNVQSQGVTIVFFLAPFHPAAYDRLVVSDKYKIVVDVENYIKILSQQKNIKVLGSFNPHVIPCDENEFYDGMHASPLCISKIFH